MTQTGSYDVQKFSTSSDGEIRRLNAQLDLFWSKEFEVYCKFGLKDGMNILDCGCGPGYLSEKLLSLLPQSSVTAVERDPSLVKVACQRLLENRSDKRCFVVENSILKLDFPDNTFDFAITRLVIEHVPDPVGACKELLRVLKPKGIVVIIDNDFEMHVRTFPGIPELGDLYSAYCKARADEGGNPKIGRELPVLLKKTGFMNVDLEIISAHSVVIGDGPFLKSEGPGIPTQLVESGYLASETYQTIISKWHEMLKNPEHVIVRQLYVATGCKSTGTEQTSIQEEDEQKHVSSPVPLKNNISSTRLALGARKNAHEDSTIDLVKIHVAKLLDIATPENISDEIALTDIGIDSEMALELQISLSSTLELTKPLPATLVFDYPTIRAIAQFILKNKNVVSQGDAEVSTGKGIQLENSTSDIDNLSDAEIEKRLSEKLDALDQE